MSQDYLRGAKDSSGGGWEKDSLIQVKDGEMVANDFFVNLWRVAHGQPMQ